MNLTQFEATICGKHKAQWKWKLLNLVSWIKMGKSWRRSVEKSQLYATSVTIALLRQAIWGCIWKHMMEKSQTNATNVTLHLLGQAIWGRTCYTKIPKNTGILFSKIPVSVFESNLGIPVFSGIPQGLASLFSGCCTPSFSHLCTLQACKKHQLCSDVFFGWSRFVGDFLAGSLFLGDFSGWSLWKYNDVSW